MILIVIWITGMVGLIGYSAYAALKAERTAGTSTTPRATRDAAWVHAKDRQAQLSKDRAARQEIRDLERLWRR